MEHIWVVISNNVDDVMGEVEGAFREFADAKKCFARIKQNWLDWAGDDLVEVKEEEDYFSFSTSDETMEVLITRTLLE